MSPDREPTTPGVPCVGAPLILAEMLRRHPEINPRRAHCGVNGRTALPFATVDDCTLVADGSAITVAARIREDYYGLTVEIVRWTDARKEKP